MRYDTNPDQRIHATCRRIAHTIFFMALKLSKRNTPLTKAHAGQGMTPKMRNLVFGATQAKNETMA